MVIFHSYVSLPEGMGKTKNNKPPMTGNSKHITYKNAEIGEKWHVFTHITVSMCFAKAKMRKKLSNFRIGIISIIGYGSKLGTPIIGW